MDKFKLFISEYGTTDLAKDMGLEPSVVSNWRTRGVPVNKCAAIERISKGSVMRWDLRPDDWHEIWPELRKRKDAPKEATHD